MTMVRLIDFAGKAEASAKRFPGPVGLRAWVQGWTGACGIKTPPVQPSILIGLDWQQSRNVQCYQRFKGRKKCSYCELGQAKRRDMGQGQVPPSRSPVGASPDLKNV